MVRPDLYGPTCIFVCFLGVVIYFTIHQDKKVLHLKGNCPITFDFIFTNTLCSMVTVEQLRSVVKKNEIDDVID